MVATRLVIATLLLALAGSAAGATAVFIDDGRLDPFPEFKETGQERTYIEKSFNMLFMPHFVNEGRSTVIAIREDVPGGNPKIADGGWFRLLTISVPRFVTSFEGGLGDEAVVVRFSQAASAWANIGSGFVLRNPTGRISVQRVQDDVLLVDLKASFPVEHVSTGKGQRVVSMDCSGKGQALRVSWNELTPWYGARIPPDRWSEAVRPGKPTPHGSIFLYCREIEGNYNLTVMTSL